MNLKLIGGSSAKEKGLYYHLVAVSSYSNVPKSSPRGVSV